LSEINQITEKIIPAYPFIQFSDDNNVVVFFDTYNEMAQQYLDAFNALSLPCWTSETITGKLLDWIAHGIYGEIRPTIHVVKSQTEKGPYNTVEYDAIAYAHIANYQAGQYAYLSDDLFKRLLTWNFYKADGMQFTVPWLKRRVARFLLGKNGTDPHLQSTENVSVTSNNGVFVVTITRDKEGVAETLKSAIEQGFAKVPVIFTVQIQLQEAADAP